MAVKIYGSNQIDFDANNIIQNTQLNNTVLNDSLTALDTSASRGPTSNAGNTALPLFGCRAFVNFDGTSHTTGDGVSHCTIRASGNVSKVTRISAGMYTIHFATAMPDANYAATVSGNVNTSNNDLRRNDRIFNYAPESVSCVTGYNGNSDSKEDYTHVTLAIFR